jgi:hypothetical protein
MLSGCNGELAPSAPTPFSAPAAATAPSPSTVSLTVRVLTRGSEQPLPDATVLQNNQIIGQTDRDGLARAQVPVGVEIDIDVRAAGFIGIGASGTVRTEERWTFYLEREQ